MEWKWLFVATQFGKFYGDAQSLLQDWLWRLNQLNITSSTEKTEDFVIKTSGYFELRGGKGNELCFLVMKSKQLYYCSK